MALRKAIDALARQCEPLAEATEIARLIDTLPGFALVCASKLTGEIGTLDRFAGEASLAVYLGMANLDNSSGERQGARASEQTRQGRDDDGRRPSPKAGP